MTIYELKNKIENNTLEETFFVFKIPIKSNESSLPYDFIVNNYIKNISKVLHLNIKRIDSQDEIPEPGLTLDNNLYVIKTNKLDKFNIVDNCIIICNITDYKDSIVVPKLENWQFIDYLTQLKLKGLNTGDIEWLLTQYEVTNDRKTYTNFFRLDNDLDKISIFDQSCQQQLFDQLYNSGEYSSISNLTVFDLTKAIVQKDVNTILQVLKVFDYIDSKPHIWILTILLNNFKNIINIQLGINPTAESLGISDKQFYVIKKHNCGFYTEEELIRVYKMLTDIEYKFKFGGLTQEQLVDYMICKIFE